MVSEVQTGNLRKDLATVLTQAMERLRETDLPAELASELDRLIQQVDQPCVVTVLGQVNAGKSTFINALLG